MLAQARGQPQNSDSFRKSGYDRKVSGGAKSATDVGWIVWKAGRGEKKKRLAFASVVLRTPYYLLFGLWPGSVPSGLLEQGFWRLLAFCRGVAPLILCQSQKTLSVEKRLF